MNVYFRVCTPTLYINADLYEQYVYRYGAIDKELKLEMQLNISSLPSLWNSKSG